jgi:hypothetical protein
MFFKMNDYQIYKTKHFIFYTLSDPRAKKKIKKIAYEAEKAIRWAKPLYLKDLDFLIEGFIFDSEKDSQINLLEDQIIDNFAHNHTFQVIYDQYENNPVLLSETILHESCHIYQYVKMNTKAVGLREGHATMIEFNYIKYQEKWIKYEAGEVRKYLEKYEKYPHDIFHMTHNEFQNYDFVKQKRDPQGRYKIAALFMYYICEQYGINKMDQWLKNAARDNFYKKFNHTYHPVTFQQAEMDWLDLVYNKERFNDFIK